MSYLLAFAGFAALIVLHEFGHFVAAKAVGMRVERFALFFPPLLVKVRRGETEYGIGAIPLGGYVKITGMNPAEEIPPEAAHRAYYRQPVWKRIVVILAGPFVNFVIAFLIFFAIFHWYQSQPTHTVGAVTAQPATGQLQAGDKIVAVDGRRHLGLPGIQKQIASHRCAGKPHPGCRAATPVRLKVRRDGRLMTIALRPRYQARFGRTLVGFMYGSEHVDVGALTAAGRSFDQMGQITAANGKAIAHIFAPKKDQKLSSVVGAYAVTQESFANDPVQAFYILGVISLALAIINMFPFLPLDGGHIFWALAEKVRGRAIPFSIMERAGVVGFVLIIFLFGIGLSNDIGSLTGGGFGVR